VVFLLKQRSMANIDNYVFHPAGVPGFGNNGFYEDKSQGTSWKYDTPQSAKKSYNGSQDVFLTSGWRARVRLSVNVAQIEVPYKVTVKSKRSDATAEMQGVWRGETSWGPSVELNYERI
jgi:hypothetical protein